MNNQIKEKQGELAFELHSKISQNEKIRRQLLFENAGLISQMQDTKLYRVILGDDKAPWSAYLSQHEVYMSRSRVDVLSRIYKKFIKELKCEDIGDIPLSKLSALIPLVTRENVNEWLTKARVLTAQDFNDEVRVAQGKTSYLNCPHEKCDSYQICRNCGFRHI